MKTSKIYLNLGASEKSGCKEPYVPTIELNVVAEDKNSIDFDRSSMFINTSQLLSSKRFNDAVSMMKSNPFQINQKQSNKNKLKTSLEIYSNSASMTKNENSITNHQRNWSGIHTDSSKQTSVFTARSDIKQSTYKGAKSQKCESKLIKYQNRLEFNPVEALDKHPNKVKEYKNIQ